jgi:hypothetical protein
VAAPREADRVRTLVLNASLAPFQDGGAWSGLWGAVIGCDRVVTSA